MGDSDMSDSDNFGDSNNVNDSDMGYSDEGDSTGPGRLFI